MKKMNLACIFCILFAFSISAQNNKITLINDISNSIPENLYIIDYAFGNFMSENKQSVIIFCDDVKNKNASKQVLKTFIYEINNNKSKLWGELNINCAYYNYEENINSFYKSLGMKQDLSELGTPYKFGWIGDFNENGITELMLVQSSYSEEGSTLEFWEFNKGVFKKTLQAKDDICFILSANKKNHSMKLERNKYSSEADDYVSKISEIVWDSENFTYIEK